MLAGAGLVPRSSVGAGQLTSTGPVRSSFHVITCVQVLVLVRQSVAVYVKVRVLTHPLVASTFTQLIVGVPQSSVAATLLGLKSQSGTTAGLHPKFMFPGHFVKVGATVSIVHTNVCRQILVFPQLSNAV